MSEVAVESQVSKSRLPGFREGCIFWLGFTLVALILRGVRWDENFEFAQAMTGLVPYDDAHPLRQYALAAYNLQVHSSALILLINDDPVFLCGIRNLLFIAATVLSPFMLGAWLSRNAWIGHFAALFILLGVHLEFDGAYPQFIWPGMFSNGHIGIGYALIFAATLAAGHLRAAGLLLGLMPMIHLGQIPPALTLAGLYAFRCIHKKDLVPLKNAVLFFSIGIVCCVIFYFIQQQFVLPAVTEAPYFSEADPRSIWQGRITGHDMHRQIPGGNIHIITVATMLIGWLGWHRLRSTESTLTTAWFWLTVYATCVTVITYGIMAAHTALGSDVPYLLLGWLPYRLLNHLAPILIVMTLTLLTRLANDDNTSPGIAWIFVSACVIVAALKPLLPHVIGGELYTRYFFHNDFFLFALIGPAAALLSIEHKKTTAALVVAWVLLAVTHRYGAFVTLASSLLTFKLLRNIVSMEIVVSRNLIGALIAVALAVILIPEYQNRTRLPVGDFEAEVAQLLDERGEPDALLLAHPQQVLLQAQTGHPVVADMATEFHASYRPALGPSVQAMYEDVYGIWFDKRAESPPGWQATWSARTPEEWAAVRERWSIEYLVAPNSVSVQLEPLLSGDLDTLYALPQ